MLDQIVSLMNKYPGIKLEIEVHTDNQGEAGKSVVFVSNPCTDNNELSCQQGHQLRQVVCHWLRRYQTNNIQLKWLDRRNNRRIDFFINSN